jgi:hypothetical protein
LVGQADLAVAVSFWKEVALMFRRFLVPLLAAMFAIWAGLASLTAAGAEPVFPPGLRIGLEAPGDLKPSTHFPGFEDVDRKVAITILDLPARAYEEIERSVFAQNQSGLTGLKRESFPFASGVGFLISGQAVENGVKVNRWFLLASAVGGTVQDLATLINVQVPEAALSVYSDEVIRKALASVTFRPSPVQEQLGLLPFKLNELAGFRVTQVMAAGGVILTDGPTDDISQQPYMIVTVGGSAPAEADDRAKFARDLLSSAPLRDLSVTLAESMRIGGLPGYEIRAQAKGLDGAPLALAQWVRFGSGGFLRIVGVGRKEDWDALFTRFRAVRDGIDLR